MCWKSARRSVCWHVCASACVCVSLDGHVAYVSLTLWVTEKLKPPSRPTVTRYLHPLFFFSSSSSTNMQVHMRGGRGKEGEVAKGTEEGRKKSGGVGREGGRCACRFMIIPKQMLLSENSLNC